MGSFSTTLGLLCTITAQSPLAVITVMGRLVIVESLSTICRASIDFVVEAPRLVGTHIMIGRHRMVVLRPGQVTAKLDVGNVPNPRYDQRLLLSSKTGLKPATDSLFRTNPRT